MRLLLAKDVAVAAIARWRKQYPDRGRDHTYGFDCAGVRERLSALRPDPTVAEIKTAFGQHKDWAENRCDECGRDRPELVLIGEEPEYEARWQELCPDCVKAALAMFPKPPK